MKEQIFGQDVRRRLLFLVIIAFFVISLIQLFNMQVLQGSIYTAKANENSIKPIYETAPRGIFYDRNKNVLVGNKPSFTLRITPDKYDTSLNRHLETMLGFDKGYIKSLLKKNRHMSPYVPIRIAKNVDYKVIAWYEENSEKLPGVDYVIEMRRDYSFGVRGSHLFGYLREINKNLLDKMTGYSLGDEIGYVGIEKKYESVLRGEKGIKYLLVDSHQKTIGRYNSGKSDVAPIKGFDLMLTIDKYTQQVAESLFTDKRGALVAIEPGTGEILAMVSSPMYDLENFSSMDFSKVWKELNEDEDKPLFNRATMSIYSPGSTFKMVSAIAGIEEGIITEKSRFYCNSGYYFGNRFFKCLHYHGSVDLITSIEKSCNAYYYQLALKVGLDNWSKYAAKLGFGRKTGIDIGEETAGLLPTKKYYEHAFGKDRWPKGILLSLGIGQGELSVTPLQLAQYVALIANYGKSAKPHLVKGFYKKGVFQKIEPEYYDAGISKSTFDIVRNAMYLVVNGAGTATNIRLPDVKIAGKTGTAQNPHGDDHSIFIGFAPYENPKIAVAVVVENAGYGSTVAAPIARDVIKAYLKNRIEKEKKIIKNEIVAGVSKIEN
ncbi:penicillin-binding protein 2 [Melioribacter sp. OK-6-Me]|uniref:penicillin-binding protein 2 n=1 Tax=unclassified Melioribacter TaxID=2627329 RepID=UPI003EDAB32B